MNKHNTEKKKLSSLLPYDLTKKKNPRKKNISLQNELIAYQFLLAISKLAIQSLQKGDFENFDSLVGENACQIRAVKMALIASRNSVHFNALLNKIDESHKKTEDLLSPSSIEVLMYQGISTDEIITQNDMDILLDSEELFLIESYILTEMRELQSDGEILPDILRWEKCSPIQLQKKNPSIPYSFLNRLSKKLRIALSERSVDFVRRSASKLEDESLVKMVSNELEVKHNDLACIPTFWSFKTLVSLAKKEQIPILMHVKFLNSVDSGYKVADEEFIYFKVCNERNEYFEFELEKEDLTKPACIIQGVVCPKNDQNLLSKDEWKNAIKAYSIIDILLAVGADHRQYPDASLDATIEHEEHQSYRTFARKEGFSLCNPTTFFAQHMYCAQPIKTLPAQTSV